MDTQAAEALLEEVLTSGGVNDLDLLNRIARYLAKERQRAIVEDHVNVLVQPVSKVEVA